MQFVRYIVFVICLAFLASCLKDQGNYSLKENDTLYVDTVGLVLSYQGQQNAFRLQINPKVIYSGDTANLEYLWRAYPTTTTYDTLSKTRSLDASIPYAAGNYIVEYVVKDKSTGLRAFMRYTATVVSPGSIPTGWMIGYETASGADMDLIRSPDLVSGARDTVYQHVYSKVNGGYMAGKPQGIFYLNPTRIAYMFTTQEAAALRSADLLKVQNFSQMFIGDTDPPYSYSGFVNGVASTGIVVNNKHVYWANGGSFVGKVLLPDGSDQYEAAGAMAPMTGRNAIFYDQRSMRFLQIYQSESICGEFANAASTARFNLNNIGKKLIHIERGYTPVTGDPYKYAFFKDEIGSARYLYIINTASASKPDIALLDISNAPGILDARYYAVSNKGPAVVYATSSSVYSFTVDYNSNFFTTPTVGFTVPTNEEITSFSMTKMHSLAPTGHNESQRLLVATWNEAAKEAKVYVLVINEANGVIQPTPASTFTVGGKVGAMGLKVL